MKFRKVFATLLVLIGLFHFASSSSGFALLGPFAPWMEETNGLRLPGDIGGPMDIGSEYRWNVPIVTYGFDQSFLDYFGTNGVTAVESAIQILNDLPPASDMVLTSYPLDSRHINYVAQAQGLMDLKSATLWLLLEQMGLTSPTRYVYVIHTWNTDLYNYLKFMYSDIWNPWIEDPYNIELNFIIERNFDPETLAPANVINGTLYSANVSFDSINNYIIPFSVDPLAHSYNTVADVSDAGLWPGTFYAGLTRDDVGGLRYLLSADNINFEQLLPDVLIFGPRRGRRGGTENGTWRPGVEKVTFVRQPSDFWTRRFRPFRYHYTDVYLKNDVLMQQRAEREVRQPDFLFCAADTGENNAYSDWSIRTGTINWLNNAALNGNTDGEGPGVIRPRIKITFHKMGPLILTGSIGNPSFTPHTENYSWGSFDGSTNFPVSYPAFAQTNTLFTVRLRFWCPGSTDAFGRPIYDTQSTNHTWHLRIPVGGQASLQVSTNQINWTSVATATNTGAVTEWYYYGTENPPKFFRAIPQ